MPAPSAVTSKKLLTSACLTFLEGWAIKLVGYLNQKMNWLIIKEGIMSKRADS